MTTKGVSSKEFPGGERPWDGAHSHFRGVSGVKIETIYETDVCKKHIDYIKWKNVLKISRYGLFPGGSLDMVCFLGEVPIWFVSWGKSRYGLVAGEVPIWFGCWGIPEM